MPVSGGDGAMVMSPGPELLAVAGGGALAREITE